MASTSDKNSVSAKNCNLIEQFCSVTGANKEKASKMLEVCSWNLEMAINMHVDSDYQDEDSNTSKDNSNEMSSEDNVRPPIPPSREILVEDYSMQYSLRGTKRRPRSIFDGFRDFEAEAKWQEMELGAQSSNTDIQKRRKTLEDLFRPPLDLMHRGSFESAREAGSDCNKWLMVNIQDSQEFACQVLNRDVWSNQTIKSIIAEHFIFWQVHCHSAEGQRYMQFYNPVTFPYVAVIDPRTGENLIVWNKIDPLTFSELVSTFLSEHAVPDGSAPVPKLNHIASLLDVSEEQQIKAAVEASLKDVPKPSEEDDEEGSDIETFESDSDSQHAKIYRNKHSGSKENDVKSEGDDKTESKSHWQDFLGEKEEETTDLVLRLPDGKRERISWPCTSKVKALLLYAESLGYDEVKYELVTNFPRKNLGELPVDKTLKDIGLYPREMIFIQLKHSP